MIIEKIYLPRWMAWFFIVIFIPLLIFMEYEAFYGKEPYPILGAVFGFIFVLLMGMMFMVSYRKLPYLIIERQTKLRRSE
jgi:hypothetical protein